MKRAYMKPAMRVYELQQRSRILAGSVNDTEGPFHYGGPGDEPGR